jgi:hypothetical protein
MLPEVCDAYDVLAAGLFAPGLLPVSVVDCSGFITTIIYLYIGRPRVGQQKYSSQTEDLFPKAFYSYADRGVFQV